MTGFLDQDIKFLPGVGPRRAELLEKELKIKTFRDMIYYFPYKYIDRTKFYKISEIHPQMPYIQVKGKIRSMDTVGLWDAWSMEVANTDMTPVLNAFWYE